jgi:hypothetical protein
MHNRGLFAAQVLPRSYPLLGHFNILQYISKTRSLAMNKIFRVQNPSGLVLKMAHAITQFPLEAKKYNLNLWCAVRRQL